MSKSFVIAIPVAAVALLLAAAIPADAGRNGGRAGGFSGGGMRSGGFHSSCFHARPSMSHAGGMSFSAPRMSHGFSRQAMSMGRSHAGGGHAGMGVGHMRSNGLHSGHSGGGRHHGIAARPHAGGAHHGVHGQYGIACWRPHAQRWACWWSSSRRSTSRWTRVHDELRCECGRTCPRLRQRRRRRRARQQWS